MTLTPLARLTGKLLRLLALAALIPLGRPSAAAQNYQFSTLAGLAGNSGSTDGTGTAARFYRPAGIAIDSAGNVYLADTNSTIRKVSPAGVVTTLAGTAGLTGSTDGTGSAASFNSPAGVGVDASGNLYVAEEKNHTIRKITPAGVVTTFAGLAGVTNSTDGVGSAARFNGPRGVAVDAAGNVYVGDRGNHTIRKITPAGAVTTLAGLAATPGSTDGTGSGARFNGPRGVAVDGAGNVYVADNSNHTIRKVTAGGVVTTLAGLAGSLGFTDGTGSAARFTSPFSVAVDAAGNVYVADTENSLIRRVTPDGVVTTLAGLAGLGNEGSSDGTGSAARFNRPRGLAADGAGGLYVADTENHTIRKGVPNTNTPPTLTTQPLGQTVGLGSNVTFTVTATGTAPLSYQWLFNGTPIAGATNAAYALFNVQTNQAGSYSVVVTNLAGSATSSPASLTVIPPAPLAQAYAFTTLAGLAGSFGSTDSTGSAARFSMPYDVATDVAGNVYVADGHNHTIRKVTPGGTVTTLAGAAGFSGSTDGAGTTARFNYPGGVAVDGAGNVYVGDSNNETVRKISPGGVVTTLAGLAGATGTNDGTGSAARFYRPNGLAVDGAGNLYVADTGNNTIRKVTPAGEVTTLAGMAGSAGSADGTGSAARFTIPVDLTVDGAGNVYVADTYNHTIRKVTPSGVVTTIAGLPGTSGSMDGTGSLARFGYPGGIATDWAGNLYVGDTENNTVRRVTYGGVVTTLGGLAGTIGSSDGSATAARFARLNGVAVDGAANLYVADTENHTIRKGVPNTNTPPTLTTQPLGQTVGLGSNVTFTVTATGTAPLSYQWLFNGTPIAGATNAAYALFNVQTNQAGSYSVVVTNLAGSATSSPASLTVNQLSQAITFAAIPNKLTTDAPFALSATASSGLAVSYTSSAASVATISGSTVTIVGAGTATITAMQGGNATYAAAPTVTQTLTVYAPPALTTQPLGRTVGVGSNVTFTVTAAGTAPLAYQWRKDGIDLTGATAASLSLTNVQFSQAGSYTVVVTNAYGSITSSPATLTVNQVITAPSITTQPLGQTVGVGSNVTFTVTATGTAPLSYQWYYGTNALGSQTNATLALSNVQTNQAGSYSVVVTNLAGSATSSPASLTVNQLSQAITFAAIPNKLTTDAPFALSATASSGLPVSYTSSAASVATISGSTVTIVGAGTATITAMQGGNATYAAAPTVTQTLTVYAPPAITTQPLGQTVGVGSNVTFTVTAAGTAPLSYQWRFNGTPIAGATNAAYALFNVQTNQAGSYSVVVTNLAGSATSSPASLTVNQLSQTITTGTVVAWGNNVRGQTTVPAGLSGVTTIAAGEEHTVALKSDGTVVAWGLNNYGQTTVPAGLSGVQAIAAGRDHTVALKSDGTMVAWGSNAQGQTAVPAGLTGVAAIAAGRFQTVALKSDGTVVAWGRYNVGGLPTPPAGLSGVMAIAAGWEHTVALKSNGTVVAWGVDIYGQATVPAGLSGVTAISAGNNHTAALKSDGTVVAWGFNGFGGTSVPAGLSGVTAIAAGGNHTAALKNDGTVVAWGWNEFGQTTVPPGLSGVAAIASGGEHTLALIRQNSLNGSPVITTQPLGQTVGVGSNVTFTVTATGTAPLSYQWRKDGVPVPGATNAAYALANVQPPRIGDYSVIITNAAGSITSSIAPLNLSGVDPALWRGLVAYYPFNGNANDETGNGINGIVNGATITANRFGQSNQAYNFSSATAVFGQACQWIQLPFSQAWNAPSVTLSAWIKPSALFWAGNSIHLASIMHLGDGTGEAGPPETRFQIGEGGIFKSMVQVTAGVTTSDLDAISTPPVVTGAWQHLVMSYDGQYLRQYFNGVLVAATPISGTIIRESQTHTWSIGDAWMRNGHWYYFDGIIDDIRIYNRALADTDVSSLHRSEAVPASLTTQPLGQTVGVGSNVTFSITATGTAPLAYQWRFNGTPIAGATNASYTLFNVQTNQAGSYSVVVTNLAGSVTSSPASLTVNQLSQAITFAAIPNKLTTDAPFALSATASSGLPVSYTSSNPGVASVSGNVVTIVGAGTTTITAIQAGNATYLAAGNVGQTLAVYAPPVITTQPLGQTVGLGSNVTFTVTATGTAPLSYQWRKDGVPVPGATNAAYALANVQPPRIGDYSVIITNAAGSITSSIAPLNLSGVDPALWRGLVAYYPFNGNANDETGNGNNGINTGLTLSTNRVGELNSAYTASSKANFITTTIQQSPPNVFSLCAWFKTAGDGNIIGYFNTQNGPNSSSASWDRSLFVAQDATGRLGFYIFNGSEQHLYSTGRFDDNQWHQAVVTLSAGGMILYADGLPVATNASVTSGENGSSWWRMCRDFVGSVDDVRIYNRALSSNEVAQLYQSELPPSSSVVALDLPGDAYVTGSSLARKLNPVGLPAGAQSRTFEAWVYLPSDYIPNTGIFSTWDASYINGSAFGIKIQSGQKLYLWAHNNDRTSTGSVPTGQWAHIATVYNSTNGAYAFLINGQDAGSGSMGTLNTRISEVSIGNAYDTYNFKGKIRDARIWNRALSAGEIQQRMNGPVDVIQQVGLAGYWPLSEGAGSTAFDQTTNANHLTLNGAARWYVVGAPSITSNPTNATVNAGGTATFSITATGTAPLAYQWRFNGTPIAGATNAAYALFNVQTNQAGSYSVVVTNLAGSATSSPASLTVNQLSQTITFAAIPNKLTTDAPFMVSAGASSGLPVSFSVISGPATISSNIITLTGAGSVTVRATQLGDAVYLAAAAVDRSFAVLSAGTLQFTSATASVAENAGTVTLSVTRAGGSDGAVAVGYTTANGTATAGSDYTATSGTLSWPSGDFAAKTITVSILDDSVSESAETFTVALTNASGGATFGAVSFLTVTIADNDAVTGRVVRLPTPTVAAGAQLSIPVELLAQGNENALGFSVSYDSALLNFVAVSNGPTVGAVLNVNTLQTNSGRVGIAVSLPAGQTFVAGTQEVARLVFQVASLSVGTNTTLAFGNAPVAREVSDATANSLAATYQDGVIAISVGFEADVTPRPNGNGTVSITDWVQVGRFAAGLDTIANASELMRADCAPRSTLGNGSVTITDWVQAGRYAAGLDPLTPAGGPTALALPPLAPQGRLAPAAMSRVVRVLDTSVNAGNLVTVTIELAAQGDENALGFSLNFDASKLTYSSAAAGVGAVGATLNVNASQVGLGRLGIALALPAGQAIAAGNRALVAVTFSAASEASGLAALTFGNIPIPQEVSDSVANSLTATFTGGTVTINGGASGPVITVQPASAVVVPAGSNVLLSVTVSGTGLGYQWLKGALPLAGATAGSLSLTNVNRASAGNYLVVVTNAGGSVTSSVSLVRVLVPQRLLTPERLGDGRFRLRFGDFDGGLAGAGELGAFEVYATTNVFNTNSWARLTNGLSIVNGQVEIEDTGAPGLARRFYRIMER